MPFESAVAHFDARRQLFVAIRSFRTCAENYWLSLRRVAAVVERNYIGLGVNEGRADDDEEVAVLKMPLVCTTLCGGTPIRYCHPARFNRPPLLIHGGKALRDCDA